jgi:hypothetical protein
MPERMPRIPYDGHPLYGNQSYRASLKDRLVALARVGVAAGYVVGTRLTQLSRRIPAGRRDTGRCLTDLARDGASLHRLSPPSRQAIAGAAQTHLEHLARRRDTIPNERRSYGDHQLTVSRGDAPQLHAVLEEAFTTAGILASVSAYLGCRARVRRVTLQINDDCDVYWRAFFDWCRLPVPRTAFLHVDNTYGVIKAILYLSDVSTTNGPFSYVPGTHRLKVGPAEALVRRATDIWLDSHPDERRLFQALPETLRVKAKFGDDIADDSDWGDWLVRNERAFTSADGDVVVFDTDVIHRGGIVQQGQRRIIQVMMS